MKKILAVLIAVIMVFGLAACGQTAGGNTAPAANNTAPAADNTAPAANNTAPAANNTAPPANNTAPAANDANNANNAQPEIVPKVATTTPNGMMYSWRPSKVFFKENAEWVYRDYCKYTLKYPLQTKDGAICMALDDLYALYAPDFKVAVDGDKITVEHATVKAEAAVGSKNITTYKGAAEMAVAPYKDGDAIFVPIFDFMTNGFGKTASEATKLTKFYALTDTEEGKIASADTYYLEYSYRIQPVGLNYYAFWFEEGERLEPVVVYVPSSYDESKPNKMIVQLHGAGGNSVGSAEGASGAALCEAAERYGYMVCFSSAYGALANFGMWVQPAGQFPITDKTDPKNPAGYSDATLADIKLSDLAVQTGIAFVEEQYNVDENNLFIMGISMGGCGTWYQVYAHPGMFNACSPSGAFVEPDYFDWSKIDIPTLYIGGTQDRNGFDLMLKAYDIAIKQGAKIEKFEVVGGAPHGGEWTQRLDMTMEFFDKYLK